MHLHGLRLAKEFGIHHVLPTWLCGGHPVLDEWLDGQRRVGDVRTRIWRSLILPSCPPMHLSRCLL